jgi:hypothetical protein
VIAKDHDVRVDLRARTLNEKLTEGTLFPTAQQTVTLFALCFADCGEIVATRGLFGTALRGHSLRNLRYTLDGNFFGNAEVFFEKNIRSASAPRFSSRCL